ncbi:MAG: type II toxin-antitoxin system VapB family antitoxin [Terriglobales bacterium]
MKKTLNIDATLLSEARASCGAATDTETIRRGLEGLVREAALDRLIAYREPDAEDVHRRREPPPPGKARRAAR